MPFRGLRFDPGRVDLAAVTCPPHDVVNAVDVQTVLRWERTDPDNVVRLILPRGDGTVWSGGADRYEHTASTGLIMRRLLARTAAVPAD